MPDAKIPDNQAGYEKGISATLVAHAGCNYISEAFGMLGSLMACSYESMIIDNDMVGNILRTVRSIEVNEDTLSLEVIRETVFGSWHFFKQRTNACINENRIFVSFYCGSSIIWFVGTIEQKKIFELAKAGGGGVIRQHFPIMLTPQDLKVGNGRW